MKHYTKEELLEAVKDSGGIVSEIARRLGCDWMTARKYVEQNKAAKAAFIAEGETMLDQVERCAYDSALSGDGPMIRYILSTKGKKRGWTEEDIAAAMVGDPIIQIVFPECQSGGYHDD